MDKKYFIKFKYGDEDIKIEVESSGDFSTGSCGDKSWAAEMIKSYIEGSSFEQKGKYAHDAVVYDADGKELFKVRDI